MSRHRGALLGAGGYRGRNGPQPSGPAGPWTLAFEDTFSGTSLDTTRWGDFAGREINNVTARASNISVSGGELILSLSDSANGALVSSASYDGAGVNSYLLPLDAVAEARVKFPGNGTDLYNWPAWWTSGTNWPVNGEHDVAEVLGTGVLTVNYHYGTVGSPQGANQRPNPPGYWGDAYHVYTLHRKATSADVYWDGQLRFSYPTSDAGAGHSLLLAVGVDTAPTVLGSAGALRVDYVRAWQR